MRFLITLSYVNLAVLVLASIAGVVRIKRLTTPVVIVSILVFVTLTTEALATWIAFRRNDNAFVAHFYVIVSFWLYSLCYFFLLKKNLRRALILLVPVLFTIFAVINSISYQKLDAFPSINTILSNVLLICYCLYSFKYQIDLNPFESLRRNSHFLLNTAVLVYSTLDIFVLGILDYLFSNGRNPLPLMIFNGFASIGYYIVLGIVILQDRKPPAGGVKSGHYE